MQIANGHIVTIDFTLRNPAGKEIESTKQGGPITFTLGKDRMLPGLAKVIEGMTVGETREGTIPPGELVPRDATGTRVVPKNEFPGGALPEKGARFQAKGPNGQPLIFEVISKTDASCTVQLLHPLHDVEVQYTVTVVAARRANVPPPAPVDAPDLTDDLVLEEG